MPERARAPDLSYFLPSGVRILYIPPDIELSVLTKAEIEARVQPAVTESGAAPPKDPS
jgi:hypothetical protein